MGALLLSAMLTLAAGAAPAEVLQEITVKEGDTLWGVANYYLKDPQRWPEILKYNSLPSSDTSVILPGMKLRVPMLLIKEHLRAAHLIEALNEVRYRRRAEAEWKKAWTDMELYNEDGLRTLEQARARVKFPSGETLQMDENSLVILKPEKKREEIDLLSGGVRASRTKILASDSVIEPRIEPKSAAPDFRTKLKEDKTTLVEVYAGIVDVTAAGKTVTVSKGFGTEVKFMQPPSLPKALPPPPEMKLQPSASAPNVTAPGKVTSGTLQLELDVPSGAGAAPARDGSGGRKTSATAGNVPKGGGSEKQAERKAAAESDAQANKGGAKVLTQAITKYRIQVSTGYGFSSLVLDETHPISDGINIDLKKSGLPDGVYYHRVAYMDELGFEGQFSAPASFTIDTTIPVITVTTPQDEQEIDTEFVHVEGTTEPNCALKINDKNVPVDETGNFQTAILPKNGKNVIAFVAEDRAGNIGRAELTIEKVKTAKAVKRAVEKKDSRIKAAGSAFASIALEVLTAVVIIGVVILLVQ